MRLKLLLSLLLVCTTAGCSNPYQTATVRGRVTAAGQPVTRGQIMFTPLVEQGSARGNNPGKPAFGVIDSQGNYVLSTYGNQDGAVIGKHQVTFLDDYDVSEAEEELYSNAPARYLVPPDKSELEVVAGKNEINLELVPNPEAARWKPRKARDD